MPNQFPLCAYCGWIVYKSMGFFVTFRWLRGAPQVGWHYACADLDKLATRARDPKLVFSDKVMLVKDILWRSRLRVASYGWVRVGDRLEYYRTVKANPRRLDAIRPGNLAAT